MNAWCTAVHAPLPTATSPAAVASSAGSNSGASTTQRKLQALSSIRPPRRPISSRAAPSRARLDFTGAGGEEDAVARLRRRRGRPGRPSPRRRCSSTTGPVELAVLLDQHVGQALGAALLGPLLPGVELLAGLARSPGHHDGADVRRLEHPERRVLEVVGALDELEAHPQVGLVGAVARHRLGVRHPRQRAWARRTPMSFHSATRISSATARTSSCSTKLISMSSWVNSGCRSARKSSSR